MRKLYFALLIVLLLVSCTKKSDYQVNPENTEIPLLDHIFVNGIDYQDFTYNEANLLTEEKSKFRYTKHHYNTKNELVSSDFYYDISMASSSSAVIEAAMKRTEWVNPSNTQKSLTQTFVYNDKGQLIRKNYIRTSDPNSDYTEFLYENNKISRITGFFKDREMVYTDFFYDGNGNLTKQLKYIISDQGIASLITTSEYEYDNKFNPFRAFGRLIEPGIYTNMNNIAKMTYRVNSQTSANAEYSDSARYMYEYNLAGYPVKVSGSTVYVYR